MQKICPLLYRGAKCNPLQYIAPNLFKSDRIAVNNANCLTQVACSFAIENLPYTPKTIQTEYRTDFGNFSADHNEHYTPSKTKTIRINDC